MVKTTSDTFAHELNIGSFSRFDYDERCFAVCGDKKSQSIHINHFSFRCVVVPLQLVTNKKKSHRSSETFRFNYVTVSIFIWRTCDRDCCCLFCFYSRALQNFCVKLIRRITAQNIRSTFLRSQLKAAASQLHRLCSK